MKRQLRSWLLWMLMVCVATPAVAPVTDDQAAPCPEHVSAAAPGAKLVTSAMKQCRSCVFCGFGPAAPPPDAAQQPHRPVLPRIEMKRAIAFASHIPARIDRPPKPVP